MVKNSPANAGDIRDVGSIPGSGSSHGVGNGNPLRYSCLENSMDSRAWWATVHRVTKSQTHLKRLNTHKHTHTHTHTTIYKIDNNKDQFSRQEYWWGLPFPSPEDIPSSGIESTSPALEADCLLTKPPGKTL